ncbi:hypothetical protein LEP48_14600 [Isoptericola sp. NEAU-Y5]|uniref:Putative T7SS secretion signal domain-containing protein n=1 Tax=Isoptericola luteus TaxID=2879484 RepID=A0ABS7ZHQ7_9MICO|nr:DUF308 domain-containing protein [Isoptericola sp. NEAU-Y5]MCA5891733.1 hypothetical protein [Isoptericola sp. NEAU-Y5]MCA5894566.1 hypothetical protein [Isoptericola sp. NEAU-Y5]
MVHYEHIGYDPAPGDHVVTGSLANGLTGGHETLERVKFLLGSVDEGEWVGEVAVAFRSMLHDDFEPKVIEAEEAFRTAASALETWATKLESYRDRANTLNHELGEAKAALSSAESNLYGMPEGRRPEEDAPQHEWDQYQDDERARGVAEEARADAQGVVDGVWTRIETLVEQYGAASRALLGKFETAAAMAPDDPSWWDRAVDWVGDRFEDIGDAFADLGDMILEWAAENAGLLDLISDIMGVVSLVAGIISLLPIPGAQVFALVSVLASGIGTLAAYLSAAGQAGSFSGGFTPGVIMGMVATALGAGGLTATFRAVAASATAAGRTAPTFLQFMNPASKVGQAATSAFPGFFTLAAKGGSIDSVAELGWRTADIMFDQGIFLVAEPFNWFSDYGHLKGDDYNGVLPDWGATAGETDGEGALLRTQLENR